MPRFILLVCLCVARSPLGNSVEGQHAGAVEVEVERIVSASYGDPAWRHGRRVSFHAGRLSFAVDLFPYQVDLPSVTIHHGTSTTTRSAGDLDLPDVYFGAGDRMSQAVAWFGDSTLEMEGFHDGQSALVRISCSNVTGTRRLLSQKRASAACLLQTFSNVTSGANSLWKFPQTAGKKARARRSAPGSNHTRRGARRKYSGGDYFAVSELWREGGEEDWSRTEYVFPRTRGPRSCRLHVMADHLFHRHYGDGDVRRTVGGMVAAVALADSLFRATDFDGDGFGDNVGFEIQNISVMTEPHPGYLFAGRIDEIMDYLNRLTLLHHEDYCLAVAFTFRHFEGGVLGLAWIASSDSVYGGGGICKPRTFVHHLRQSGSLNSLVVSARGQSGRVAQLTLGRTLVHELGHSFGSLHDDPDNPRCSPSLDRGVFIMNPHCADASLPNHLRFSPCSLVHINPVLVRKGHCLQRTRLHYCGNFRRDPGEDCDCGMALTCAYLDPCCVPAGRPGECRLKAGSRCSPAQSPCCTQSCQLTPASRRTTCSPATDCASASRCDGSSPLCPPPDSRPNGTVCDQGRKVCQGGQCRDSVCTTRGLRPCQCTGYAAYMCKLCCTMWDHRGCRPAWVFGIVGAGGAVLYLPSGSGCGRGLGYCSGRACILEGSPVTDRIAHVLHPDAVPEVGGWFRRHVLYLAAVASAIGLASVLFFGLCGHHKDLHLQALMVGKQMAIRDEAGRLKADMDLRMREVERTVDSLVEQCETNADSEPLDTGAAVGRLQALFPKVSYEEVARVLAMCSTEDMAVRLMLSMGYMMHGNVVVHEDHRQS